MRRFFVRADQVNGDIVTLTGCEAHHISSVLRMRTGQVVEFFDAAGTVYQTEITSLTTRALQGKIIYRFVDRISEQFPLTLAQGILKGKKMDMVVQKATELGVDSLLPVISRYCVAGKNIERRLNRWQRIVTQACKQSGRSVPMTIEPIVRLEELVVTDYSYRLCCWENEKEALLTPDYLCSAGKILLLIGPEGGLHEQEIQRIREMNFYIINLGRHVLRAETASLAAVSIVQYLGRLVATDDKDD